MQKCPNCGRELPDGAVCPCAAPSSIEARPSAPESPAVAIIRSMGASGKFLTAAISLSLVFVSYVVFDVLFLGFLSEMDTQFPPESNFYAVSMVPFSVVLFIGALFLLLPITVMWLHYGTCRRQAPLSTAALTIWKVLLYIRLVLTFVSALFVLTMTVIAILTGNKNLYVNGEVIPSVDGTPFLISFAVLWALLSLAFLSLPVIFCISVIRIIDRAKNMIATGVPDARVSRFPVILQYIQGGYLGFMGVMWIFLSLMLTVTLPLTLRETGEFIPDFSFFPALGCVVLFAALYLIMASVCLSSYRSQLIRLTTPPVPVYYYGVPQNVPGVPAYVPQPTVPVAPTQQMYGQPAAVPAVPMQQPYGQQPAASVQPEAPAAPAEPAPEDRTEE